MNLLIVDDHDGIVELLVTQLKLVMPEIEVIYTADNGKSALKLFRENRIDLVLSDILMPDINGLELLKSIRKTSNIPILLVTAEDCLDMMNEARIYGVNKYVVKPFTTKEIVVAIKEVLSGTQKD